MPKLYKKLKKFFFINNHMIKGQEMSLLIFSKYLVLGVKYAYRSYKKPLRTALSKFSKSHLTSIYIFRGPNLSMF